MLSQGNFKVLPLPPVDDSIPLPADMPIGLVTQMEAAIFQGKLQAGSDVKMQHSHHGKPLVTGG